MLDALKSVRDISRICEEEMRDITHLYPTSCNFMDKLCLQQYFTRVLYLNMD